MFFMGKLIFVNECATIDRNEFGIVEKFRSMYLFVGFQPFLIVTGISLSINIFVSIHTYAKLDFSPSVIRQVKDQNKKVANLKHKEQVEKKKSAQMLEEARRREDNLNDSSQQLQVRTQGESARIG